MSLSQGNQTNTASFLMKLTYNIDPPYPVEMKDSSTSFMHVYIDNI